MTGLPCARSRNGVHSMDPRECLAEARAAVLDERYEDALNAYVWIHHHSLQFGPAFYGVRLSYALIEWIDLGKKYPKALLVLQAIRDDKAATLRAGDGDFALFHDVATMNEYLQ